MTQEECNNLEEAWALLFKARSLARLLFGDAKKVPNADHSTQQTLANLLHHANFQETSRHIEDAKTQVKDLFSKYIGYPNSDLGA